MPGSNVINLFGERWVDNVFTESGDEGALRVDISSKGRVRFTTADDTVVPPIFTNAILSMQQVLKLGELLKIAFSKDEGKEDDDGNSDQPA